MPKKALLFEHEHILYRPQLLNNYKFYDQICSKFFYCNYILLRDIMSVKCMNLVPDIISTNPKERKKIFFQAKAIFLLNAEVRAQKCSFHFPNFDDDIN